MSAATTRTIIGLVDAGGSSGGATGGQSQQWSLILDLAGWRQPGSAVVTGERRCELPVSEDDLRALMARIGPYAIVEAEIDEGGSTATVTRMRRIVQVGARDAELEDLARRLQEPIVLQDATLGRLEFDRAYGWYAGRAEWCGLEVDVSLSCSDPEDTTAVLEAATRLFQEQEEWQRRVQEYVVEQLLPIRNEKWRGKDEAEMSAEEFLAKIRLDSISVEESGEFGFWFDDGDLFWRHGIQIYGDFSEGLTQADISG